MNAFFAVIMLALIKTIFGKNFHNTSLTADYKTKKSSVIQQGFLKGK